MTNMIRHVLMAALMALALPMQAQDLLANQAPIDKRMSALDSISLYRMLPRQENKVNLDLSNPSGDLYPDWRNEFISNYNVPLPQEYRIDLRGFCMPCDSRKVTSHFGYRKSFRRNHYGTDIKLYVGDTVRAAFAGKVRVVANEGYRKGYGLYIIIRHDNGLETIYGHLSKQLVIPDQEVQAGQVIGLGGNTGRSTGSHLHFETRLLHYRINPELLFNFEAQDALGDFYVFRADGRSGLEGNINHTIEPLPADGLVLAEAEAKNQKQNTAVARGQIHRVKQGDTLSAIAKKYKTTVAQLCKLNKIKATSTLRIGQLIKCS